MLYHWKDKIDNNKILVCYIIILDSVCDSTM